MNKQFKIILLVELVIYAANGLFTPAWYILLATRGQTIEQFGLLLGLIALGSMIAAFSAGKLSRSRKTLPLLSVSIIFQALVIGSYLWATNIWVIYTLQILYGAASAAILALEQILVAQYAGEETRGTNIGAFNGVMQGAIGFAMIAGGILAATWGQLETIALATILLLTLGFSLRLQPLLSNFD